MKEKLSLQPYKGTRDFFPEQQRVHNWLFARLKQVAVSYGFEEYSTPLIEHIELYKRKTSEEIVKNQIYSFEDRSQREVAIRPEVTPSVSRMIAKKIRELPKPMKWFSILNLYRYERPGKNRLREHWQLNCDIFASGIEQMANIEIIQLSIEILRSFKATEKDFCVFINDRKLFDVFCQEIIQISIEAQKNLAKILDKKNKITTQEFLYLLEKEDLSKKQIDTIINYLESPLSFFEKNCPSSVLYIMKNFIKQIETLDQLGYSQYIQYNPTIIRGFDYYTDIVFEVFDTNTENSRSILGGGRYNQLCNLFLKEPVNAIGFGLGDVTLENFLQTHNLIPNIQIRTQFFVVHFSDDSIQKANIQLCTEMRKANFNVELSLLEKPIGEQLSIAEKKGIPYAIIQGENELQTQTLMLKDLSSRKQTQIARNKIIEQITRHYNESTIFST